MIPASFGWSDVGSWDTLWEISARDKNGKRRNRRLSGHL